MTTRHPSRPGRAPVTTANALLRGVCSRAELVAGFAISTMKHPMDFKRAPLLFGGIARRPFIRVWATCSSSRARTPRAVWTATCPRLVQQQRSSFGVNAVVVHTLGVLIWGGHKLVAAGQLRRGCGVRGVSSRECGRPASVEYARACCARVSGPLRSFVLDTPVCVVALDLCSVVHRAGGRGS